MIEINKIYNGDCLDLMPGIEDKSIDMILTSPPYDNLRTYNGSLEWNFEIFKSIAKELFRVTKDGGVCVWIVGDATINGSETGTSFKQALYFKEIGFNLHDTMIWKKPNPIPTQSTRYQQGFEYVFILSKGKPKSFNPLKIKTLYAGTVVKKHRATGVAHTYNLEGKYTVQESKIIDNVWQVANTTNKTGQPAIFPEQLAADHIKSWSNGGDLVFDPFMGSGTTAIACINTNRNYIGIEKEEKYYDIIKDRIRKHIPQLKLIV